MKKSNNLPLIIAITGASGSIYGIKLLQELKKLHIPTILTVSEMGFVTIKEELKLSPKDVINLADEYFHNFDMKASIASGSYRTLGIIVAPCSVKTLSAIANCYDDNLIVRASDVCLKERKKVILLFRETPLHMGYINIMKKATENGAIIMPPVPAFYNKPNNIDDLVSHTISRTLDIFNIENNISPRWKE